MTPNADDFIDAPRDSVPDEQPAQTNPAPPPRKPHGRPTQPLDYDGSTPLRETAMEAYARAFVTKTPSQTPGDVLLSVSGTPISRNVARGKASRWGLRQDVRARIAYLSRPAPNAQPPPEQPETPTKTRKTKSDEVDADEIARTLSAKIREGDRDTVQAVTALLKIRPELIKSDTLDDSRPDPGAVLGYVLSFAGCTPEQIAASMGGWSVIRGRLCALLRVSPSELIDRLAIGQAEPAKTIAP